MKHNFVHGYSKNSKIGSKLISWGTKKEGQKDGTIPSHYFMVFFRKIVLEARLESGVQLTYWGTFKGHNDIVKLFIPIGEQESREQKGHMFNNILKMSHGKPYDKRAVAYFGWRIFLLKYFGKPLPAKNKYNDQDKFFCDELYSLVSGKDMSMKAPNCLMVDMASRAEEFKAISIEEVV